MESSPIARFLERKGYVQLDGGLAAELEARGHDLNHRLWSARLLDGDPGALRDAHRAFLDAGADCIISASYQATPQGLVESGVAHETARELIRRSWDLADAACEAHHRDHPERPRPVAAASIGPYGAYLADGSEYRGNYGRSVDELVAFHRERFELLCEIAPLLAIETIPSLEEARALRALLSERPGTAAWVSFSCRDGEHLSDGQRLADAAALFDELDQVIAVGVNCTKPRYAASLIQELVARPAAKPVVIYPNSGEAYCADDKSWRPGAGDTPLAVHAAEWLGLGAQLIGGCCRVDANELGRIHRSLRGE